MADCVIGKTVSVDYNGFTGPVAYFNNLCIKDINVTKNPDVDWATISVDNNQGDINLKVNGYSTTPATTATTVTIDYTAGDKPCQKCFKIELTGGYVEPCCGTATEATSTTPIPANPGTTEYTIATYTTQGDCSDKSGWSVTKVGTGGDILDLTSITYESTGANAGVVKSKANEYTGTSPRTTQYKVKMGEGSNCTSTIDVKQGASTCTGTVTKLSDCVKWYAYGHEKIGTYTVTDCADDVKWEVDTTRTATWWGDDGSDEVFLDISSIDFENGNIYADITTTGIEAENQQRHVTIPLKLGSYVTDATLQVDQCWYHTDCTRGTDNGDDVFGEGVVSFHPANFCYPATTDASNILDSLYVTTVSAYTANGALKDVKTANTAADYFHPWTKWVYDYDTGKWSEGTEWYEIDWFSIRYNPTSESSVCGLGFIQYKYDAYETGTPARLARFTLTTSDEEVCANATPVVQKGRTKIACKSWEVTVRQVKKGYYWCSDNKDAHSNDYIAMPCGQTSMTCKKSKCVDQNCGSSPTPPTPTTCDCQSANIGSCSGKTNIPAAGYATKQTIATFTAMCQPETAVRTGGDSISLSDISIEYSSNGKYKIKAKVGPNNTSGTLTAQVTPMFNNNPCDSGITIKQLPCNCDTIDFVGTPNTVNNLAATGYTYNTRVADFKLSCKPEVITVQDRAAAFLTDLHAVYNESEGRYVVTGKVRENTSTNPRTTDIVLLFNDDSNPCKTIKGIKQLGKAT